MQSNKLRLIIIFFEVVLASVLLFAVSAFLFAASYGAFFYGGTVQLIPVVMLGGIILSGPGMFLAWDAARRLEIANLVIIAVADLLSAFIFIFLILSPPSELVSGWLAIAVLSSFMLSLALIAGVTR